MDKPYLKRTERYRGRGILQRETDETFAHIVVDYDIGVYERGIRLVDTGEDVTMERSISGFISSKEPYLLHRLIAFTDLVLVLEDTRRLPLFITNAKRGAIRAKSGFQ